MNSKDLFRLWWKKRWIRILVLGLAPIGLIDAITTLVLVQTHGHEYEYNPLVRLSIITNAWPLWFLIDTISFPLFVMMIGSYYVHTQKKQHGGVIIFSSVMISTRIFSMIYNILIIASHIDTLMYATVAWIASFILLKQLLSRETDISITAIRRYFKDMNTDLLIYLATRKVVNPMRFTPGMSSMENGTGIVIHEQQTEAEIEQRPSRKKIWLKRIGWILGAVGLIVLVPIILTGVGIITGGIAWDSIYGNQFFWNRLAGVSFVIGFAVTIILFAIVMIFIMNAFDTTDGAW